MAEEQEALLAMLLVRRARGPKAGAGADAREPAEVAAAGPRG